MIDIVQKTDLDYEQDNTTTQFIGGPVRGQIELNVSVRPLGSSSVETVGIEKVDVGYEEEIEKKDSV